MESQLMQDITITLNLSELSPEKYREIVTQLKSWSQSRLETFTYASYMVDELSDKDKALLNTFKLD